MKKRGLFVILICLLLVGCSTVEKPEVECTSDDECYDGDIDTIDKCIDNKCVQVEKEETAIQQQNNSIPEAKQNNTPTIMCPPMEKAVDGECVLKTCIEMEGDVCTKKIYCPKEFIKAPDSNYCCPVKCINDNRVTYFINKEINGYLPIEIGTINEPYIKFYDDEFDKGFQMIYVNDEEDIITVTIWDFYTREYLDEDLEEYFSSVVDSYDKDFMLESYEDYEVIGVKNSGKASYIWRSGTYIIEISESERTDFLKAYLDDYSSNMKINTTVFE